MEKKKRIEIIIEPDAKTARIIAENANAGELIDGYVNAAAAVTSAIADNCADVSEQEAFEAILLQLMQTYGSDS